MASSEIAARRLCAQGISCSSSTVHDAVSRILALQAQERPSSLWAIGLRSLGSTVADVERAVTSGTIVRTWLMRGTLHFTAAEDVRWLIQLVAERVISRSRRRDEELGLDGRTYGRSRDVLTKALDSKGSLTRGEMMAALEKRGITTTGQRGYHILWHLALTGTICFGPMTDGEPSFVLLDDWVPASKGITREEALGELAWRYFSGHGPASARDLMWWSGLPMGEVREGIETASSRLIEEVHDDTTYFSAPSRAGTNGGSNVILLPAFDEYIIGYKERSALLDREHTKDVLSSNGIFYPVLAINGRARGTWRGKRSKKGVVIEVSPFSRLTSSEIDSLERVVACYGAFLDVPVSTSFRNTEGA